MMSWPRGGSAQGALASARRLQQEGALEQTSTGAGGAGRGARPVKCPRLGHRWLLCLVTGVFGFALPEGDVHGTVLNDRDGFLTLGSDLAA